MTGDRKIEGGWRGQAEGPRQTEQHRTLTTRAALRMEVEKCTEQEPNRAAGSCGSFPDREELRATATPQNGTGESKLTQDKGP